MKLDQIDVSVGTTALPAWGAALSTFDSFTADAVDRVGFVWPADVPLTKEALQCITGGSVRIPDDEDEWENLRWNTIHRTWRNASGSGKKTVLALHISSLRIAMREMIAKNEVKKLPKSYDEIDAAPAKFQPAEFYKSVEDLRIDAITMSMRSVKALQSEFDVLGPGAHSHDGRVHALVGMETYILDWVEVIPDSDDLKVFLRPKEAGNPFFYGMPLSQAQQIFGGSLGDFIAGCLEDVLDGDAYKVLAAEVERRTMEQRYKDAPIQFGQF